jgi:hypothetical protein
MEEREVNQESANMLAIILQKLGVSCFDTEELSGML